MLLNYHIGCFVLSSLCVGDLLRLGLSSARVAGVVVCWRFGAAGLSGAHVAACNTSTTQT